MAVVVRVFLMKVQNGTERHCTGAAVLLGSQKGKRSRFIPPPPKGNDILDGMCSKAAVQISHNNPTVILILM